MYLEGERKPTGFGVELADAVIRILDICGIYGIDLEKVLMEKMEFNKTRSYRHGGKTV
jgi:NTP pyrophosphatase (non-canonical NTP hydrolase)